MAYGENDSKLMLRLPKPLLQAIRKLADAARDGRGLTVSEYMRELLEQHVQQAMRKGDKK